MINKISKLWVVLKVKIDIIFMVELIFPKTCYENTNIMVS